MVLEMMAGSVQFWEAVKVLFDGWEISHMRDHWEPGFGT